MGTLTDSLKTPEIKKKILFSFLIVSVLCLLTIVPIPGLDHAAAAQKIAEWGSIGTVIDILSFRALSNVSVVSLGIFPFLVASIVMQIVVLAVPKLRALSQAGEEGTKIITKFTRYASIAGAVIFAVLYCVGMRSAVTAKLNFWLAIVLCGLSVAVGSALCGWCVELLNSKGLGDGLTIIIVAAIIRNIPVEIYSLFKESRILGMLPALALVVMGSICVVGVFFFVILVNMGEKKIRIIFAKRTVGLKQYGMQNQVVPVKVTQAGITPIIYTLVITLLPSAIIAMVIPGSQNVWAQAFMDSVASVGYVPFFIIGIVFFTYIFALMQFNAYDMSKQIKDNGGYIQGLRPGKATSQYLISTFINLNSADTFYLILICVVPMLLNLIPGFNGICLGGIGLALVGGGFIEMKAILENSLKAEEEKAKQAGKDKKRKKYNK